MAKQNTLPVSGTRDFLPRDVFERRQVMEVVRSVYEQYAFEPVETPTLERLDTLLGKYGDEGDQLIFRVLKRGEKLKRALGVDETGGDLADAGLRYDLTVPLARIVAEYRSRLPALIRRYQLQPVFRADRPARGRFREFMQCDIDIVGSASLMVETEVLGAAADVLNRLEIPEYKIRLNHRQVLRGLLEVSGVCPDLEEAALVAIDKFDKVAESGVRAELKERGVAPFSIDQLMAFFQAAPEVPGDCSKWLAATLKSSTAGSAGARQLAELLVLLKGGPAESHVVIDPFLARGLSYYTGCIFEVRCPEATSSLGGGGRYDGLIGMFSGQDIPACGFSLGLERILLLLKESHRFPDRFAAQPQILVTLHDDSTRSGALELANHLRQDGFLVDVYPDTNKSYGKQFRHASQRQIPYVALLGPEEIENGVVGLKDLNSGEQAQVVRSELTNWLGNRLPGQEIGP